MVKKRKKNAAKKDKGKSKNIILIIFLLVFIGLGVNLFFGSKSIEVEPNNITDMKVLYFYIPTCPNCQAVKPYMTYLESKYSQVTFYKYNLKKNEGTKEFNYYRKKFDNRDGGVPFAIFVSKDLEKAFLGRTDVLNLEESIAGKLNLPRPNQTYEIPPAKVGNCIDCHQKKDIPPPSTYTCETCCHSISAGIH